VLDTETTGLSPKEGHRVVEIGAVELFNLHPTGKTFHVYLDPERNIPEETTRIHGITNEKVAGCPKFADVAERLLAFIGDDPLVIHNAPFDMGFLNNELSLSGLPSLGGHPVVDTLVEAKRRHPRQRNNLDALCKRYDVDNSERVYHGALLDSEILAEVYIAMLGGHQTMLVGMETRWGKSAGSVRGASAASAQVGTSLIPQGATLPVGRQPLLVAGASSEELAAHAAILARLGDDCIWQEAAQAQA
jgi:DNA polymerase-3 subunit epsilon